MMEGLKISQDGVIRSLLSDRRMLPARPAEQLALFDDSAVTREDVLQCLTGQI